MSDDGSIDAARAWADELCAELGIAPEDVDIEAVLGIAGLAARTIVRPAAPVTTFLLGYAAGRAHGAGGDEPGAFDDAQTVIRRLASGRRAQEPPSADRAESPQ